MPGNHLQALIHHTKLRGGPRGPTHPPSLNSGDLGNLAFCVYEFSCKSATFRNVAYDCRTPVMLGEVSPALKYFFLLTVASSNTVPEILLFSLLYLKSFKIQETPIKMSVS